MDGNAIERSDKFRLRLGIRHIIIKEEIYICINPMLNNSLVGSENYSSLLLKTENLMGTEDTTPLSDSEYDSTK